MGVCWHIHVGRCGLCGAVGGRRERLGDVPQIWKTQQWRPRPGSRVWDATMAVTQSRGALAQNGRGNQMGNQATGKPHSRQELAYLQKAKQIVGKFVSQKGAASAVSEPKDF